MTTDAPGAVAATTDVARSEAANVAQAAGAQTREVMQETKHQVKSAVGNVQDDLRARANDEASKFARTLHDASRQMQSMAQSGAGQPSLATNLVREGAQAAERLASRLDEGGIDRVAGDFRTWARRNPGGFLLGAGVVGFLMGRVARNLSGQSRAGEPSASGPRERQFGSDDDVQGDDGRRTADSGGMP
jgi:hypothetical protein